ncbi:hypothetical protein [Arthrobacter sp. Marseille-P9274]|uniref:hypothetical protein n=1 Tax=Arthrobacter sp. Marseille-P9274 TaxID=2866572 RepID=UPI0021CACDC7|nr:hypothetical protein [Arthrobacter sp. Marseille-P9274]
MELEPNDLRRLVRKADDVRAKAARTRDELEREIHAIEAGQRLARFVTVTPELAQAVAFAMPVGERMVLAFDSLDLGEDEEGALEAIGRVFERSDETGRLKAVLEVSREMQLQSANDLRHWVRSAEKLAVGYAMSEGIEEHLQGLYEVRAELASLDKDWGVST